MPNAPPLSPVAPFFLALSNDFLPTLPLALLSWLPSLYWRGEEPVEKRTSIYFACVFVRRLVAVVVVHLVFVILFSRLLVLVPLLLLLLFCSFFLLNF